MIKDFCDYCSERIVNYSDIYFRNYYGIEKIKNIFLKVKNSIYYDVYSSNSSASETLVMGRGNNRDKVFLSYCIFKHFNFDCKIKCAYVKVNSNISFNSKFKIIPWFYLEINYYGRNIYLDPSFDREFMRAAGIANNQQDLNYLIEEYCINGNKLFSILYTTDVSIEDEEELLFKNALTLKEA